MHQSFARWRPVSSIMAFCDNDGIAWTQEGVVVTLVPDGRRYDGHPTVRLCWPCIVSWRVTEESYREDCWISDPSQVRSFFVSRASPELAQLRLQSCLLPASTLHFLLVGANLVVDVFADVYPTIECVSSGC